MADKAILFGVNDYKKISDLRGCVHDVLNINNLLVESFGFDGDTQIKLYQNEDVILANIIEGFEWLFDGAGEKDRLVFHFSGHGSYVPSENDDEAIDELLCLWDMDWDDGNTYLIDDDLGAFTEELPTGAHLTIILDSCNSGTGTKAIGGGGSFRALTKPDSKSRLVIEADTVRAAPQSMRNQTRSMFTTRESDFRPTREFQPVFARFIYPPADLQAAASNRSVRALGRGLADQDLNHSLLTAARDIQTAADAFIDSKYQGAFSYYLCDTSRKLGAGAPLSSVMEQASDSISSAGYSQTPQLEGLGHDQRLFGGEADKSTTTATAPGLSASFPPASVPTTANASSPEKMKMLSQLMDLQHRFFDLGNSILGQPLASQESGIGRTGSRSATEVIVYVHGISRHLSGFSDSWYASMSPHVNRTIPKLEVVWSDLVNPRLMSRANIPALDSQAEELRLAIERELEQRREQVDRALPPGSGQMRSMERGGGLAIDDFVRYMTNQGTRNAILQRFHQVVRPLLESGTTVHVVSHSWGTVVAYEALRNLDTTSFSGSVANLFVAGSALSIGAVQWNLFQRQGDGRKPVHVNDIINVDAGGDIVGGPISGAFTVSSEHVGLTPTGCRTIPFTSIAFNPGCAHSSYFHSNNVAVNQDIFARWINSA